MKPLIPATRPPRHAPDRQALSLCPFCHGSGACFRCEGSGTQPGRKKGLLLRKRKPAACGACGGTMVCQLCRGVGKRPTRG